MDNAENQSAVWPAAKRGALLGVYVAIAVNLALVPFAIYAIMSSPSDREDILESGVLRTIGGFVRGFCLMAAYLAVTGAVIMGAIGFIRSRRQAQRQPPHLSSHRPPDS